MKKQKNKYILTVKFETENLLNEIDPDLIQFENGLPYFVETKNKGRSVNNSFVYGSGKIKLSLVKTKKRK